MRSFDLTNAELTGQSILPYLNHMRVEDTRPLLQKHGIEEHVQPDKWYPADKIVAFLWDVAHNPNSLYNLVSIGMEATRVLPLPPEVEKMPFEQFAIYAMPMTYMGQFRGADLGFVRAEKVKEKHLRISMVTPLPDDGWYGSIYGLARRLLPKGTQFRVEYDKDMARGDLGGEETIIHVTWE
ncbi:MAG: hypothetical protein U0694_21705 [Anaerolineae bacterium]